MAAEQTADLKQARERNSRARKTTGSHGMTRLQAATLLREQGGRCQICDHVLTTHRRAHRRRCDDAEPIMAVVDHCHETGAIRGMLCCSCNQGLGFLKDNPDWMRKAIEYLTRGS